VILKLGEEGERDVETLKSLALQMFEQREQEAGHPNLSASTRPTHASPRA
jgi:hypothetical protein